MTRRMVVILTEENAEWLKLHAQSERKMSALLNKIIDQHREYGAFQDRLARLEDLLADRLVAK